MLGEPRITHTTIIHNEAEQNRLSLTWGVEFNVYWTLEADAVQALSFTHQFVHWRFVRLKDNTVFEIARSQYPTTEYVREGDPPYSFATFHYEPSIRDYFENHGTYSFRPYMEFGIGVPGATIGDVAPDHGFWSYHFCVAPDDHFFQTYEPEPDV